MLSRRLHTCAALAVAALALAGCTTRPVPSAAPPAPPAPPAHLQLTGCVGWRADHPGVPNALAPGRAPPGWEPDPAGLGAVLMLGLRCDRLALGPFERGPVHLVLDAHSRASIPSGCAAPAATGMASVVLNSLWVDDAQVAAFLNATYGMPARLARVGEAAGPAAPPIAGNATLRTWGWSAPGQPASTLTVLDDGTHQPYPLAYNLLWQRGAGIGSLAAVFTADGPLPGTARPAHGTLQPPMLLAGQPLGAFAGTGLWLPAASMQGALRLFRDLRCEQPEA